MESFKIANKLCLMLLALFAVSGVKSQTASYQPECNAWDTTITQMQQSLSMIGGSVQTCAKSTDCTGLSCTLKFWDKKMTIDMKLYPCIIPPQMRLMVRSTSINFEQSVTHGDTYNLPGFQYTPFMMMPAFKLAAVLVVHFEKVANGMRVGLYLEARGFGTRLAWPLMPDTVVPTPPCPSATPPVNAQCIKMDQLLSTMQTPAGFVCEPADACRGFSCAGNIGLLGILEYDLNATLVVNSCENPISYTVTLLSNSASLTYIHRFTHSDTVPVRSAGLPPGTTANLTVTMSPSLNLDAIDTSVKIDICIAPMTYLNPQAECYSAPLLTNQPVPIPPCNEPLPTPGAPLPQSARSKPPMTGMDAECNAWSEIEQGMTKTVVPGYGFDWCNTNVNCMGMTCHAIYETNNYQLYMELFHCAKPITLLVTVDSAEANFHYAQNITEGTSRVLVTVFADNHDNLVFVMALSSSIEPRNSLTITVRMTPVPGGVRLGGNVSAEVFPGIPLSIPVIKERLVPTPPCDGVTARPGAGPTAILPQWPTNVPSYPNKPGGGNPKQIEEGTTDYDNEAPQKDPLKQKGVNGSKW
ncbi:uncharacterized protein [Amphiura filiformis]|uniref:uncharacterized protein n=1 Tax=Amphiura filiformis TaxID=82378 RepID=UPI003B2215F7